MAAALHSGFQVNEHRLLPRFKAEKSPPVIVAINHQGPLNSRPYIFLNDL